MRSVPSLSAHDDDTSLFTKIRWNPEKLAWTLLLLVALLSRLIGLGDRALSHDESLHAVFSWQLFAGQGYEHDPMMHGPLKFVLNAISFFLFGANDWSVRLIAALFSVALIALVWFLRRWLGRTGAIAAAIMLTISPVLLYYGRYMRDEVILAALLVALTITVFRYLETRHPRWLAVCAGVLALSFLTMEAAFIFGAIFGIFLVLALVAQLWSSSWEKPSDRSRFRASVASGLGLALPGILLLIFRVRLLGEVLSLVGFGLILVAGVLAAFAWRWRLRQFPEIDLIILLASLALPFLSPIVMDILNWPTEPFLKAGQVVFSTVWRGWLIVGILFAASSAIGIAWLRKRWLTSAGLFWAIALFFFTTLLTNGQGINTGIVGSLGYWIPQQEIARGGQPWYYFFLLVPLYEFLPLVLSLGGGVAWIRARSRHAAPRPSPVSPDPQEPPVTSQQLFNAFLVFWPLATWITFTYVGEKMPWHVVYFAVPMALLGGQWIGTIIDEVNWEAFRTNHGVWLAGSAPVGLILVKVLFPVASRRPFSTIGAGLSNKIVWVLALIFVAALIYGVYRWSSELGKALSLRVILLSCTAILTVLTLGVTVRFSYIDYDYATEPMVYAHGTPDLKLAMQQIEEISRRYAGDQSIELAYDADSSWPLEWYLRDYPNRVYYGDSPNREVLDAPIVLAGHKTSIGKVRPYLGDRYYEFTYRLVWWPRQTYWNLSWQRILDGLNDPVQRGQFWDVVIHRRHTTPTAEWDPSVLFSLFIRKDIAEAVWGSETPTATTSSSVADPFASGWTSLTADIQLGLGGTAGSAPGQFDHPRSVAVDTAGRIYVADSGNNRIQVFAADGTFLQAFGSTCKLDASDGCIGDGRGQFNEPWGIAVGRDGGIYIADTWNHRVQKFDAHGAFQTMWGQFGSTDGTLGRTGVFYGPRGIAVGKDGDIYVVDTGNKRIQVFSPEGDFVAQFGGGGSGEGAMDEPIAITQSIRGDWLISDSWNRRIQRFDRSFQFIAEYAIPSWDSTAVGDKPFIAVDDHRDLLYATDPSHYRVLAFSLNGGYRFSWGQYGNDAAAMMLPNGIAVGPTGEVFVVDSDANRVLAFAPVEPRRQEIP